MRPTQVVASIERSTSDINNRMCCFREYVIPKKSPDSIEDIPTIPDLDDLQDILEKEIPVLPQTEKKVTETASALAEVGSGISGSADSVDAVLEVLNSYIPRVELDSSDIVWTVDSLLAQLAEEMQGDGP